MKIYLPQKLLSTRKQNFIGLLFAKELCRCDSFALPWPNVGWCLERGLTSLQTHWDSVRNSIIGQVPAERNLSTASLGCPQHGQRTLWEVHCTSNRATTVLNTFLCSGLCLMKKQDSVSVETASYGCCRRLSAWHQQLHFILSLSASQIWWAGRGLENMTFLQFLQKDSTTLLLHPAFAQGKVYIVGNFFLPLSPQAGRNQGPCAPCSSCAWWGLWEMRSKGFPTGTQAHELSEDLGHFSRRTSSGQHLGFFNIWLSNDVYYFIIRNKSFTNMHSFVGQAEQIFYHMYFWAYSLYCTTIHYFYYYGYHC